jgi:hypothetical protein
MSTAGLPLLLIAAALGLTGAPANASEDLTPYTQPSLRSADDCAVASRRFEFHAQAEPAAPSPAAALGRARLRPLVASPCRRGPVARDV